MAITGAIMTADARNVEGFRQDLLRWYDAHARTLPWRARGGVASNPYHVWLSEIMLQQTTVQAVIPYFLKFLEKWPTVHDLERAEAQDIMQAWAGLGYYARARNLHKCAQYVSSILGGIFPTDIETLKTLPGVGDYTAAAISAIAFNRPANVVDGNVERVMARIFAVIEPLPDCKPALKKLAAMMAQRERARPGDYAQSLMDLGATICTPQSPKCMICPVAGHCEGRARGIAASLPARREKGAKPQKHGYVYWVRDSQGRILFERRGEIGLLGGTIGLPTSDWTQKNTERTHPPFILNPMQTTIMVRHGFTHFDLELAGWAGTAGPDLKPQFFWAEECEARSFGLPTLFKKAFRQFLSV
jgi:A/G-specific adenine glycosylase